MADHDDLVDANDLLEVARATRVLVLRLDGIKGENGVLSRIESASDSLEKIDANLTTAVEKVGDVAKVNQTIEKIPEVMISAVDTLAFRTAVARVLSDETAQSLEQLQDVSLDRLDNEMTRRGMKIAEKIINELVEPSLRLAASLARLKRERHTLEIRAAKAEKALADHQALSETAEQSVIDQIERIRVSATQPNRWALFAMFALGWACAVFAADAWSVITHWIVQQPIPGLVPAVLPIHHHV